MKSRTEFIFALAFLLAACSPNLSAEEGYSAHVVRMTYAPVTATAQSAQAIATQSANEQSFNHSQTLTAQPAADTATAIAISTQQIGLDLAQTRAAYEALSYANSYSATMEAFTVLSSNTQKRIAENNRAMAESQYRANAMQAVWYGGTGLLVFGFGVLVIWTILQLSLYIHNTRKDKEKSDKWRRIFEAERLMIAAGIVQTSAGTISAVTLAEKHVSAYQAKESDLQQWRSLVTAYVQSAVQLSRTGETRYPFSEPVAVGNALITHPETGEVWREGYRRMMGWLIDDCKVMARTGKGGKTDWDKDWTLERFEREFSRTALPTPPDGPIPRAKILGEVVRA